MKIPGGWLAGVLLVGATASPSYGYNPHAFTLEELVGWCIEEAYLKTHRDPTRLDTLKEYWYLVQMKTTHDCVVTTLTNATPILRYPKGHPQNALELQVWEVQGRIARRYQARATRALEAYLKQECLTVRLRWLLGDACDGIESSQQGQEETPLWTPP
jgi:hypothetical protein